MDDDRARKRMASENLIKLRRCKPRRIAALGLAVQSGPGIIRCVGGEHGGDKRSEGREQMLPELLSGSRLVESSHELERAIKLGPSVAVHGVPKCADCPPPSRIRQMTYCADITRCYHPHRRDPDICE